jgi:hypothetical protein
MDLGTAVAPQTVAANWPNSLVPMSIDLVSVLSLGSVLELPKLKSWFRAIAMEDLMSRTNVRYRFNPGAQTFSQIPGALAQIAVGGGTLMQTDEVWGVNNGYVYRFNFNTNAFDSVRGFEPCQFCIPVFFSQIVVGAGYEDSCHPYEVWGISYFPGVNVYRYNYCTSLFDNTPTVFDIDGTETQIAFTQIAVDGGCVWGLSGSSVPVYLSEYNQQSGWAGPAIALGPTFQQITIGINGVWAVDSTGLVWNWQSSGSGIDSYPRFTNPGGLVTKIASGEDGVWIIYNAGKIARYDFQQATAGFTNVALPPDANPAAVQIAVGSGAGVWVLDASDEVFTFVRP